MYNETESNESLDLTLIQDRVAQIRRQIQQVLIGQDDMLDLLCASLLIGGHVLLEGVPGIAKTLSAKMLARTIDARFSRIQFTPDLMPADVLGSSVFNPKTTEFNFKPGPIFANVVLIDEINRAPAKTQSALFEVMEERQATVDGITHPMGAPFMVIATQNPVEQEGTYKLPEAQLDRFLFKVVMEYPSLSEEQAILRRFNSDFDAALQHTVEAVIRPQEIAEAQRLIERVYIREELLDYIAALVYQTRNNADLFLGASPRASLAIMRSAKAVAAMDGRSYVTPDDIRYVSFPVLNHRVILTPEREMEGYSVRDVIDAMIRKVEVPR
ncbi:MAG: AAA family ATPase [Saprospiraceae bacterium]